MPLTMTTEKIGYMSKKDHRFPFNPALGERIPGNRLLVLRAQHPTSNIEHPRAGPRNHWMLGVRGWMLDVSWVHGERES